MGAIKNWIGKFRFHFNDMPIGGLDAYSIGYSSAEKIGSDMENVLAVKIVVGAAAMR
eukprot:TRINITY_DN976_c0_g1_i1.p3 TRINITY_DN976_c0_g1~~TRINITY_DN976_c0_g1_i1.p3  ORF type:complete len:57 (+),score=11.72 TRINITY_DN976_c0_g1_i1:226-396(+)